MAGSGAEPVEPLAGGSWLERSQDAGPSVRLHRDCPSVRPVLGLFSEASQYPAPFAVAPSVAAPPASTPARSCSAPCRSPSPPRRCHYIPRQTPPLPRPDDGPRSLRNGATVNNHSRMGSTSITTTIWYDKPVVSSIFTLSEVDSIICGRALSGSLPSSI